MLVDQLIRTLYLDDIKLYDLTLSAYNILTHHSSKGINSIAMFIASNSKSPIAKQFKAIILSLNDCLLPNNVRIVQMKIEQQQEEIDYLYSKLNFDSLHEVSSSIANAEEVNSIGDNSNYH